MTLAAILKLCSSNKERGFRCLYEYKRKDFHNYFRFRVTSDEDKISELVIDSFIKIFTYFHTFDGETHQAFTNWMDEIVRTTGIDFFRKNRNLISPEFIQFDEGSDELLEVEGHFCDIGSWGLDKCVSDGFARFVERWPHCGYVLVLSDVEGWSIRELAQELGRTEDATKTYLSACRRKARRYIAHCRELLDDVKPNKNNDQRMVPGKKRKKKEQDD